LAASCTAKSTFVPYLNSSLTWTNPSKISLEIFSRFSVLASAD